MIPTATNLRYININLKRIRLDGNRYLIAKMPVTILLVSCLKEDGWIARCNELYLCVGADTKKDALLAAKAEIISNWLMPRPDSIDKLASKRKEAYLRYWVEEDVPLCFLVQVKRQNKLLSMPLDKREAYLKKVAERTDFWEAAGEMLVDDKKAVEKLLRNKGKFCIEAAHMLRKAVERVSQCMLEDDRVLVRAQYDSVCETNKIFIILLADCFRKEQVYTMQEAFSDLCDDDFNLRLFAIVTEYEE